MTPEERKQALFALIAARLELAAAEQCIKRSNIAFGRVAQPTVFNVLKRKNYKLATLLEIADALDCDVEITITRRSA